MAEEVVKAPEKLKSTESSATTVDATKKQLLKPTSKEVREQLFEYLQKLKENALPKEDYIKKTKDLTIALPNTDNSLPHWVKDTLVDTVDQFSQDKTDQDSYIVTMEQIHKDWQTDEKTEKNDEDLKKPVEEKQEKKETPEKPKDDVTKQVVENAIATQEQLTQAMKAIESRENALKEKESTLREQETHLKTREQQVTNNEEQINKDIKTLQKVVKKSDDEFQGVIPGAINSVRVIPGSVVEWTAKSAAKFMDILAKPIQLLKKTFRKDLWYNTKKLPQNVINAPFDGFVGKSKMDTVEMQKKEYVRSWSPKSTKNDPFLKKWSKRAVWLAGKPVRAVAHTGKVALNAIGDTAAGIKKMKFARPWNWKKEWSTIQKEHLFDYTDTKKSRDDFTHRDKAA